MKKSRLLKIGFLTAICAIIGSLQVISNSSGAPNGHTGAPNDGTCLSCHSGFPLGSGAANSNLLFDGQSITEYIPGRTYVVTLGVTEPSSTRFGFSLSPRTGNNARAGTLTASGRAQVSSTASQTFVTHTTSGSQPTSQGNASWQFTWTAPATGVGPINLFYAFMGANGNGNTSGDRVFTHSLRLNQGTSTNLTALEAFDAIIFPNPTQTMSQIKMNVTVPMRAGVALYDIQGKLVQWLQEPKQFIPGEHLISLSIPSHIGSGTYFVQIGDLIKPLKLVVNK